MLPPPSVDWRKRSGKDPWKSLLVHGLQTTFQETHPALLHLYTPATQTCPRKGQLLHALMPSLDGFQKMLTPHSVMLTLAMETGVGAWEHQGDFRLEQKPPEIWP